MRASTSQLAIDFRPQKPRPADSVKAVISDLYGQVGGVPEVMLQFGVGKSQAYAYTDPLAPDQISFERVAKLTSSSALAAAKYLAERARCVLVALPGPDRRGTTMALLAASLRSHAETIAEIVTAKADGKVTPAEKARARKQAMAAICDLVSLQASLEEE